MSVQFEMKFNISTILILVAIVVFGVFMTVKSCQTQDAIVAQNIQFQELKDGIARAENDVVKTQADLDAYSKSIGLDLSSINNDLNSLGAKLVAVGQTVAAIKGYQESHTGSDAVIPHTVDTPKAMKDVAAGTCPLCDTWGYTQATQVKDVKIGDLPMARVEFDASLAKPWSVIADDLEFQVDTTVGEVSADGMFVFHHKINLYNKSRAELKDKPYNVAIASSTYKQIPPEQPKNHILWWSPHLDLGISGSVLFGNGTGFTAGADLGFSTSAWGIDDHNMTLRFLRLGIGINIDKRGYAELDPVLWNLGSVIPFLSDTWFSIGVMADFAGDGARYGLTVGVKTVL